MDDIVIKSINIADHYATVSEMMHGLHTNEKRLHNKTALWESIQYTYMRHVIAMQEECDGICLMAYVCDQPAGFIFGYSEEPDDSRIEEYVGKELYVSDGYVLPEYRRKGIYKMLNARLEAVYIGRGVGRISRHTLVVNEGMRALLEQQGYVATRILYEKWM
jgi:GNAT superfamily N-acetyltransferase